MRPFLALLLTALFAGPLLAAEPVVVGQDCQISWTAPTTNADGSPLTDLAGYRVYVAQTSQGYQKGAFAVAVPHPTVQTTCQAAKISQPGPYYLAVTALDQAGNESAFSTEVALDKRDVLPPAPPGSVLVIDLTVEGSATIRGTVHVR